MCNSIWYYYLICYWSIKWLSFDPIFESPILHTLSVSCFGIIIVIPLLLSNFFNKYFFSLLNYLLFLHFSTSHFQKYIVSIFICFAPLTISSYFNFFGDIFHLFLRYISLIKSISSYYLIHWLNLILHL